MKMDKSKVRSKKEVVGMAEYRVFESVAEAAATLGEPKVLELVNAQERTNELNRVRGEATGTPSKTNLRKEATSEILQECVAGKHPEVLGDSAALERLVAARMEEIEKRIIASRPVVADPDAENEEEND